MRTTWGSHILGGTGRLTIGRRLTACPTTQDARLLKMPGYATYQLTQYATLLRGFAEHHGTGLLAASAAACAGRATRLRRDKRRVRGIASVGGRPQCRRRATGGLPQGNDGSGGRRRRATGTEPSAAAAAREGPLQLQFRARDGSGVGGRTGPERDAAAVHLAVLDRRRLVAASTAAAGAFHRAGELIAVLLQREQAVRAHTEAAAAPRGNGRRNGPPQSGDAGPYRDFAPPLGDRGTGFHRLRRDRDRGRGQPGRSHLHGHAASRTGRLHDSHTQSAERL